MAHINSGVIAISQTPNETKFQKTLGVNDYYWGAEDSELPLGHIQMLGKSRPQHPARGRAVVRPGPRARLHGQARDRLLAHDARTCPHPDNRVTVDRARQHPPRQDATTTRSRTGGCWRKLKGLLGELGCHEAAIPRWSVLDQRIPLAGIAHQCGTVRFGDDPATSALDVNCKAHDLDNLYVVDTSFFPSSSAVNPALTAMANALRVGDHLLERLGASVATAVQRQAARKEVAA